jgi:hypothetical protein
MKTARDILLGALLALLLLFLFMLPAFATGSHASPPPTSAAPPLQTVLQNSATKSSANSRSKSQAKSSADARSQSTSGSSSRASGGKAQSSLSNSGNASQSSVVTVATAPVISVDGSDPSVSTTDEVIIHGDETTYEAPRLPVSSAIAGGTNTTADCRYSVGGGAQGSFLGLSLGIGRKDRDCERRDLANHFYAIGNPDAADVIMCRIKELREAFGEECLAWLRRSRPAAAPVGPTRRQIEQREAFERGEHLK